MNWYIEIYDNGKMVGVLGGAGRNRGTLDYMHGRTSAYRIARQMNQRNDGKFYKAVMS